MPFSFQWLDITHPDVLFHSHLRSFIQEADLNFWTWILSSCMTHIAQSNCVAPLSYAKAPILPSWFPSTLLYQMCHPWALWFFLSWITLLHAAQNNCTATLTGSKFTYLDSHMPSHSRCIILWADPDIWIWVSMYQTPHNTWATHGQDLMISHADVALISHSMCIILWAVPGCWR